MIDKKRVKIEISALAELCQEITWDLEEGWIELRGIAFPTGWTPRTGALRFELPDTYPGNQPKAYLPESMRYEGEKPRIMLRRGPDGWVRFCLHKLELDAEYDTLVSLTRLIETSLRQPNSSNPFKEASPSK